MVAVVLGDDSVLRREKLETIHKSRQGGRAGRRVGRQGRANSA